MSLGNDGPIVSSTNHVAAVGVEIDSMYFLFVGALGQAGSVATSELPVRVCDSIPVNSLTRVLFVPAD